MKIFEKQSVRFYIHVAAVSGLLVLASQLMPAGQTFAKDAVESTYDRVQRTATIRCGYSSWDPNFYIDAATGEKRGIFHDVMEEAGKRLGVKVEWTEELGWGSIVESVKGGRVDMACAGYWLNHGRIKNLQSTTAQLYAPLYIYVRSADAKKFSSPETLDDAAFTVSTIDGSAEGQIVARRFTNTKNVMLPELNTTSDNIQNLLTGKADFVILDAGSAKSYMDKNPGKIASAFPQLPMQLYPTVILLPPEETALKGMMDNILMDIENDGTLDAILKKYDSKVLFLRNAKPEAPKV